jgi:hypothetical protein
MPPIRTIVIGAFIGAIAYFALVNFMGSFLIENHAGIPTNIKGFYDNLSLNSSSSSISVLSSQFKNASTQLSNGNIVAGTGSVIGIVSSFFTTLPNIINGFMNFTALELAYVGIPTTYAVAAAWGLLLAVIVLGLVSAIFIFGV